MPRITARISAVLVIVFGLSLTAASSAVPEPGVPQETSGSEPLPAKIVKAWTDAGATAGWMGVTKSGRLRFVVRQQPGELAVVVPAFRIKTWRDNMVSGLPAPGRPYGLNLVSAQVTDAGLKELAGLKSLQSLSLATTNVTDVGLKELAGLKSLQSLELAVTKVTDAGLKELAGLKNLQLLDVTSTQVTHTGVNALQRELPACKIDVVDDR